MARILVIISMMLTSFSVTMSASESQEGKPVKLTVKITKPVDNHSGASRTPAAPVYVYQDGHFFYV